MLDGFVTFLYIVPIMFAFFIIVHILVKYFGFQPVHPFVNFPIYRSTKFEDKRK